MTEDEEKLNNGATNILSESLIEINGHIGIIKST